MKSSSITFIILLLTYGFAIAQSGDCKNKYDEDYVPKNLKDAITYLDCTWSEEDKTEFKIKPEEDAVSDLHFGTGRAIRNNWGLWKRRNNWLTLSFNARGITHPDDISSIILTSFHRHLNNKDIQINEQVKYYKEYWKKSSKQYKDEEKLISQKLRLEYDDYEVGDTVKIAFTMIPPYKKGGLKRVNPLHNESNLKNKSTCFVEGLITSKKRKRKNHFLIIRITDICGHSEVMWNAIHEKHGTFKVNGVYNFFNLKDYFIKRQNE